MACGTRDAVIGGDPWRQDHGVAARDGPSVQSVRMRQADGRWRAASGAAPGVPPVVAWRVRSRVQARGAGAFLARAPPVARQSDPWGRGQRMARGGGRTIHPVAFRPAVARASQASCVPAPAPV